MRIFSIFRMLGQFTMMLSVSMITPIIISLYLGDGLLNKYLLSFIIVFLLGFTLWLSCNKRCDELKDSDGFLVVVLFWVFSCLLSSIPFCFFSEHFPTFTDALFETVSGYTTTGASILLDIDSLPISLLFYRQQLNFLGGMGIIILAVAILPILGIGGMQLYKAEASGPLKEDKLTPRISETAKILWNIYFSLMVLCAFSYWFAGMDFIDAIGESFATVSTGGFSMHSNSFAYYESIPIQLVAIVFMILGGINFSLHFIAIKKLSLKSYWLDEEIKVYFAVLFIVISLVLIGLYYHNILFGFKEVVEAIFSIVSLSTTTGFTSGDFSHWPTFIPFLIIFSSVIGACTGSTSGGIKIMRFLLLFKQIYREMFRLLHPNSITSLKFSSITFPSYILQAMWGFLAVFIFSLIVMFLGLLATGLDLKSSLAASIASLSNSGTGIGNLSVSFENITYTAKWIMVFGMLLGRLEIFTLIILFLPIYWRK